ncbi:MAG: flippase-like domain-containing protein [Gemmatimonadetes bacterium]|nr:flippase-like domain-containing protein [Gemmatimonadota bacterium]
MRAKGYRWAVGFVVTLLFLALALRRVEWGRTAATLKGADPLILAAGAVFLLGTFVLFSIRWRVLLSATARVRVRDTFSCIMIGYFTNTVLPFRLGDLARAALMGRRYRAGTGLVLGSVVLERVLDALTVLSLAAGLSFVVPVPVLVRAGMTSLTAVALVALAVLWALAVGRTKVAALMARVARFLPWRVTQRLSGLVQRFALGLSALRDGRQLVQVAVLSLVAWGVAGLSTVLWVEAFHLGAPWYAGFFVLAVINLGAAIPASPGSIGVYHYMAMLALSVWVTDKSVALAYAVGTHGVMVLINVLIGGFSVAREGLALGSVITMAEPAAGPTLVAGVASRGASHLSGFSSAEDGGRRGHGTST